jgi:uncharacterized protein YndB with AHSA1/START domain
MYANYTIRKEKWIHAPIAKVWETLTEPHLIYNWLGTRVETNWEEGSPITFSYTFFNKSYTDKGIVLQNEPMHILSYSFWSAFSGLEDEPENYTVVTFELSPGENVVHLIMLHHNIHNDEMYEYADKNWEETLSNLKELAEKFEMHAII